jgi:hypothetical protein
MNPNDFRLDMSGMFMIHDALRRDLRRVVHSDTRTQGWALFETMLLIHHQIEDELLWPVVRDGVADRPDDLALLDQMTSEHAAIEPLLAGLDQSITRDAPLGAARSALEHHVLDHLAHEEADALPLVDRTLTDAQWAAFGQASAQRMGPEMSRYLPWVLDGADDATVANVLTHLPAQLKTVFVEEWRPAYQAADRWTTDAAVGAR